VSGDAYTWLDVWGALWHPNRPRSRRINAHLARRRRRAAGMVPPLAIDGHEYERRRKARRKVTVTASELTDDGKVVLTLDVPESAAGELLGDTAFGAQPLDAAVGFVSQRRDVPGRISALSLLAVAVLPAPRLVP